MLRDGVPPLGLHGGDELLVDGEVAHDGACLDAAEFAPGAPIGLEHDGEHIERHPGRISAQVRTFGACSPAALWYSLTYWWRSASFRPSHRAASGGWCGSDGGELMSRSDSGRHMALPRAQARGAGLPLVLRKRTRRSLHFAGFFGALRAASNAAAFSACFSARDLRGLGFLVSLAPCVSVLAFGLFLARG